MSGVCFILFFQGMELVGGGSIINGAYSVFFLDFFDTFDDAKVRDIGRGLGYSF